MQKKIKINVHKNRTVPLNKKDTVSPADLQESHRLSTEADTIIRPKKKSWLKRFLYGIYKTIYTILNGNTPEVAKELQRIDLAMKKVDRRSNFLRKDFFKNRDELFRLLSIKEQLVNYRCHLLGYWDNPGIIKTPSLSGTGDSNLVDTILDLKW